MNMGVAIIASLNLFVIGLLVIKRKGDGLALFLTLTSYPLLALIANGSLEWIPALGFIFQNGWGLPLLMVKPQSGILAALAWFMAAKNKALFFIPAVLTILLSFVIWGNWPAAHNRQIVRRCNLNIASSSSMVSSVDMS